VTRGRQAPACLFDAYVMVDWSAAAAARTRLDLDRRTRARAEKRSPDRTDQSTDAP
jgi:hypothetical protein